MNVKYSHIWAVKISKIVKFKDEFSFGANLVINRFVCRGMVLKSRVNSKKQNR